LVPPDRRAEANAALAVVLEQFKVAAQPAKAGETILFGAGAQEALAAAFEDALKELRQDS
jgi:hypothetical protein